MAVVAALSTKTMSSLNRRVVAAATLPLACSLPVINRRSERKLRELAALPGGAGGWSPCLPRLCHAESEAPRRPRGVNFADRLNPIAYSYAP